MAQTGGLYNYMAYNTDDNDAISHGLLAGDWYHTNGAVRIVQ